MSRDDDVAQAVRAFASSDDANAPSPDAAWDSFQRALDAAPVSAPRPPPLRAAGLVASHALVLCVGAALALWLRPAPPPRVVVRTVFVPAPPAPTSASPPAPPPPPAAPSPPARVERPSPPRAARSPSAAVAMTIDEERALIDGARAALGADPAEALRGLARHREQAPNGFYAQERDAFEVIALARLRRRDEARSRAEAFRARYPSSVHLPSIEGALDAGTE